MKLPDADVREIILNEIRRLAKASQGHAPGRLLFERETGIKTSEWLGRFWARWGDALTEAGFSPNEKQQRLDEDFFMKKMIEAFRFYRRVPTAAEFRIYARRDEEFPTHSTINKRYGTKEALLENIFAWVSEREGCDDIVAMLQGHEIKAPGKQTATSEGFVYLIKSGAHYKIGRSDEIERRLKEIKIAMPDVATLVHSIRTDDPAGIEAYWHRRFSDKRANGEWFKLTTSDVSAFKRRKYQ
jgi:hypothetical protein